MSSSTENTPETAAAEIPAGHGRGGRLGRVVLLGLGLAPFALILLLLSEPGWRLLAKGITAASGHQLQLLGASGSLAGEFGVRRLHYENASGLSIGVEDLSLSWRPMQLLQGVMDVKSVRAARLEITPGQGDDAPPAVPTDLALPLTVNIDSVVIERLRVDARTVVELDEIEAGVGFVSGRHRLDMRRAKLRVGEVAAALAGSLSLEARMPFTLGLELQLDGEVATAPVLANLRCGGTLLAPDCSVGFGSSYGAGSGQLALLPFASWPLGATSIAVSGIDPARWRADLPTAKIDAHVALAPESGAIRSDGKVPRLIGQVRVSNAVAGAWSARRWPLAALESDFYVDNDLLVLDKLRLDLANGGRVRGDFSARRLPEGALPDVSARLQVSELDLSALHASAPPSRVAGRIDFGSVASMAKAKGEPRWRLQIALEDKTRRAVAADIDALISTTEIDLQKGSLRAFGASSSITGRLGIAGSQAVELSGRLVHFDPGVLAPLPAGEINVSWSLKGQLAASQQLKIVASSGERSHWLGQPLRVDIDADWAGGAVRITRGELDIGGNRLSLAGQLGEAGSQLSGQLDAGRLDRLSPALLPFTGARLGGALRGQLQLTGTLDDPAGSANLQGENLAYGEWGLDTLVLTGRREGKSDGQVSMDASGLSRLEKTGRQPLLRTATIRVGGRPERHRATLDLTAGAGRALLELSGQRSGTGVWQGRLEQLAISDSAGADGRLLAPVDVSWTPRQGAADLAVGELRWRGQFGELTVTELGRRAGVWRSRGQWRDLPVAGLLDALAAPKAAATAAGDLRLMAQWTARLDRQAEAVFSVQRQSGDGRLPALVGGSDRGGAIALGLKTLKFDGRLRDDQVALGLDLASEALGNANGRLEFAVANGDAGWQLAPGAPLRGELDLSVPDLGWLGRLSAGSLQLAGRVSAKASIAGTAAAPTVRGQISGDGLGVIWRDEGIQLRDGTLRADIDERALIIRALRLQGAPAKPPKALPLPVWVANGSGGDAVVAGEIAWRDQQGHLDFRAERFAVLQRPDLWLVASGSGRAVLGSNGRVDAKGTFRVDAAAIEIAATAPPRLGDDVKIRGAAPAEAGDGLPIDAIFDLDFGDAFQFSGRGLSGRIEGKLNLAQLGGAEPRAVGVVELKNGRFDAYGQLLEVERGIVNFQGPLDNPGLNVLALRPGLPVKAGVRVAGSVRQPRISLYSDPPLSEPEKLSWVVLGRGSDTASGADASTMLAAAQALLQSEGGGPLKQIAGALGIDEVSVGNRQSGGALVSGSQVAQSSGTTEASPAAQVIVVGKRLSSTTTLAYEQTLSGVGAVLKLTRQLTRSLSVTARTGAENALSLQWSKTFR